MPSRTCETATGSVTDPVNTPHRNSHPMVNSLEDGSYLTFSKTVLGSVLLSGSQSKRARRIVAVKSLTYTRRGGWKPWFLGRQTITCGGSVSLDCQDVLFETENAFFTDEREIGLKDLPKYILPQSFASRLSRDREFFLLQCRTRGAKYFSSDVSAS